MEQHGNLLSDGFGGAAGMAAARAAAGGSGDGGGGSWEAEGFDSGQT